jgi:hypothetical protein
MHSAERICLAIFGLAKGTCRFGSLTTTSPRAASVNAPGALNDDVNEDHKLIAAAVPPAMTPTPDASQVF